MSVPAEIILFAVLTIGLMGGTARGQNAFTSPAKTTSATAAAKDPTPIPLAEVVLQSRSVSDNLREIKENLSAHQLSDTVNQKVTALTNDIEAGLSENSRILTANPFLYELGRMETGWREFGDRLSFWTRILTARATELTREVARLDQFGKTWEQTLKLAQGSGAPGALVANAFGYVGLANLLGQAVLGAACFAFMLYAVIRIADGLLFGILKVRPIALLGAVRRHRPLLERLAELGLRWLAVLLWLSYTLELFAVREPFLEKSGEVLNADLNLIHCTSHSLTY
jgi:hypothetical protein